MPYVINLNNTASFVIFIGNLPITFKRLRNSPLYLLQLNNTYISNKNDQKKDKKPAFLREFFTKGTLGSLIPRENRKTQLPIVYFSPKKEAKNLIEISVQIKKYYFFWQLFWVT